MNYKKILTALIVAVAILVVGYIFINDISWLTPTDSAILYLSAIIGSGCYLVSTNSKQ